MIHTYDHDIVEPVTLDEVKDHIGYDPNVGTDDDALSRSITASRQLLESNLECYIAQRDGYIVPDMPGPVELPYPCEVRTVTAEDEDGVPQNIEYTVTGTEHRRTVHYRMDEGYTNPRVEVTVGFTDCPEDLRMAITDLVKARYDRAPIAPVLDDIMLTCYAYRKVHI